MAYDSAKSIPGGVLYFNRGQGLGYETRQPNEIYPRVAALENAGTGYDFSSRRDANLAGSSVGAKAVDQAEPVRALRVSEGDAGLYDSEGRRVAAARAGGLIDIVDTEGSARIAA